MDDIFKTLIKNNWFSETEIAEFCSRADFIRAIECSTSPVKDNIFNALNLVPYNKVKVLILGQDPYPNPMHAHGLAFSSLNSTTPGSLRNIFKALDSVYGSKLVDLKNNDLTPWAKSGVLLLNTSLTYRNTFDGNIPPKENKKMQSKEKTIHMSVWAPFIDAVVTKLLKRSGEKLVMLLWGGDAKNIVLKNIKKLGIESIEPVQGKILLLDNNVMILYTDHPSQVKINLGGKFLEQAPNHFIECDNFLGGDKINWTDLGLATIKY